jgi:SAM-dependent methyltransferase
MPARSDDLYSRGGYLARNPSWHEEHSPWKARHILRTIARNKLEPRSVCEVGCGAGGILEELYRSLPTSVSFVGYDISPHAYERARGKAKDRLQFHLADFLAEATPKFDLLLVIDVIEHVEDYFSFLRLLRNRATYKIFHIPLDISVQKILLMKPLMRRRYNLGHIHYFTKETALASLGDTGHDVIDYFYTAAALDRPPPSPLYALGRWPLKLTSMISQDLAARLLGGHSLMVLTK